MEIAIFQFTHGRERRIVKAVKIERDVGLICGRGHTVTLDWTENSYPINVGDVIRIEGKTEYFLVHGVELQRGIRGILPKGALIIRPFEGVVGDGREDQPSEILGDGQ